MATVTQAYQFALDPTPRQRRALASHCGAARVAYNWGLELFKTRLEQRQIDPTVVVPWTLYELQREWNRAKDQAAPWWPENSKEAYKSGLDSLARALRNWSDSRTGRRKGRPMGFPRWKKKARGRQACRFSTGAIRVLGDRKHVQLPRIGVLKTHESTRKLARRIEKGTARILAATISRTADRWFVSFTVEVERHIPTRDSMGSAVGVDVGVRHLAILSTGAVIANPRALEAVLPKLRRLNRELARRKPGSSRRNASRRRYARLTPAWPVSAVTRCTSSPRASPRSAARLSWSTSMCPPCHGIAGSLVRLVTPGWASSAVSSPIRPLGTGADSSSLIPSIPRPRRVRPAAG
jgi:putative transposase